LSPASTATSARSTASPSTCASGPPSPPPSTSRRRRPHHRAPRHRAARAPFRDPHRTHRDDGSMGPSTDISRSRRAK